MRAGTIAQKLLFGLPPETAHGVSITALRSGLVPPFSFRDDRLAVTAAGLTFPNPLGMAAGYDKNAEVPDALLRLGFGFAEVGTVTPLRQPGNQKPRIFRLEDDAAVINRLGFNNAGHDVVFQRLVARRSPGIVGVNIGANKESPDRIADYRLGVGRFAALASYITVNISSPNTPGLRGLQDPDALHRLLTAVTEERSRQAKQPPIFLKIAPDLDDSALEAIAASVLQSGIEGMIISNTTIARPPLKNRQASETGGLSGKPLFHPSTVVLAKMRRLVGPELTLIGVGGVDTAETALDKIQAGADLVQLYTGMIYRGAGIAEQILRGLQFELQRSGAPNLRHLRDSRTEFWASGGI